MLVRFTAQGAYDSGSGHDRCSRTWTWWPSLSPGRKSWPPPCHEGSRARRPESCVSSNVGSIPNQPDHLYRNEKETWERLQTAEAMTIVVASRIGKCLKTDRFTREEWCTVETSPTSPRTNRVHCFVPGPAHAPYEHSRGQPDFFGEGALGMRLRA